MVIMNCIGCNSAFKKKSKSGYCGDCFHKNLNNVKTEYGKKRWASGVAKKHNWKARGASLTEKNIEDYNAEIQCGICGNEFNNDKVLDHCHQTGKYRGALCRQCNTSLGKLGDNIDLVLSRLKTYANKEKW